MKTFLTAIFVTLVFAGFCYAQDYTDAKSKELGEEYGFCFRATPVGDAAVFSKPNDNLNVVRFGDTYLIRDSRVDIPSNELESIFNDLKEYTNCFKNVNADEMPFGNFVMILIGTGYVEPVPIDPAPKDESPQQIFRVNESLVDYWKLSIERATMRDDNGK